METKNFFQELIHRISSPTPDFFQKIIRFAIAIVAGATAIKGVSLAMPINPTIVTVCEYIIAFGTAMGVTAKATKKPDVK